MRPSMHAGLINLGNTMATWRKKPAGETFSDDEVAARLADELPGWTLEGGWIRRKYKTTGWKATMMVVTTIGHIAEAAWHHPDLNVSYAFVTVKLMTHDAKGITEKDFALARQFDAVLLWRPEAGGALEGTPDDPRFRYIKYE